MSDQRCIETICAEVVFDCVKTWAMIHSRCQRKKWPPVLLYRRPSESLRLLGLGLNNSRGYEEDQFVGCRTDRLPFEQIPENRKIAEKRNLLGVYAVVGLNNAANYDGSSIADKYLGSSLLSLQFGVIVHLHAEVGSRVFHVDVQEDRAFIRDLRRDLQSQKCVDISRCRWPTQLGCSHDRNAHALAH